MISINSNMVRQKHINILGLPLQLKITIDIWNHNILKKSKMILISDSIIKTVSLIKNKRIRDINLLLTLKKIVIMPV